MLRPIASLGASAFALALIAAPALAQDPDLSAVSEAVSAAQNAGLADTITGTDELTIFVPTNDALSSAPSDALSGVTGDQEMLTKVIQYYVIPGSVSAEEATQLAENGGGEVEVTTLGGENITIMASDGKVMIKGNTGATATVTMPDIKIGNATLHVVDGLVLPEAPM